MKNKKDFNRRDFLALLGGGSALFMSQSLWARSARMAGDQVLQNRLDNTGFVISSLAVEPSLSTKTYYDRKDTPSKLLFSTFSGSKIASIDLPFLAHQTVQNPQNKEQFVATQRWGKNAIIFNCNKPKELVNFKRPHHVLFFGHAAFTHDGQHVMMSCMNFKDKHGEILIYDVATRSLLQTINTQGDIPHEIQLSKDGETLFVANAGNFNPHNTRPEDREPPSIVRIDLKTYKVIEQHKAQNLYGDYSHFVTTDEKNFLVMGVGDNGSLALLGSDLFVDLTQDPLLKGVIKGEALSGRLLNKGQQALITLPMAGQVAVVDFKEKKIIKTIHVHHPRGISTFAEEPYHLISSGAKDQPFVGFSDKDLAITPLPTLPGLQSPPPAQWIAAGPHFTEILWPFNS